jgi:hypothetical protein
MATVSNGLKHNTLAALASVALMASLAACSAGDDEQLTVTPTLYDIAEVTELTDEHTVFTVYQPDADEPATLTAAGRIFSDDSEVEVGNSVFMAYTPAAGKAYVNSDITVQAWARTMNLALLQSSVDALTGWDKDPVWINSLWRAGNKIIVRAMLTYDTEPRTFALVLDKETLRDEYPEAYLVHYRSTDTDNFRRQYYAAFDVANLWTYATCRGLRIHVNNSNVTSATLFVVDNPNK